MGPQVCLVVVIIITRCIPLTDSGTVPTNYFLNKSWAYRDKAEEKNLTARRQRLPCVIGTDRLWMIL